MIRVIWKGNLSSYYQSNDDKNLYFTDASNLKNVTQEYCDQMWEANTHNIVDSYDKLEQAKSKHAFSQLNNKYRDYLTKSWSGVRQVDIAKDYNISQNTVHYNLKHIEKRLVQVFDLSTCDWKKAYNCLQVKISKQSDKTAWDLVMDRLCYPEFKRLEVHYGLHRKTIYEWYDKVTAILLENGFDELARVNAITYYTIDNEQNIDIFDESKYETEK